MTESADRTASLREQLAITLLAVTAILTAWSGFQASKWGGEMSIAFSQASAARIEASRLDGEADVRQAVQVGLFTQWIAAYGEGNNQAASFLESRFPEPLATAFQDWLAQRPLQNAAAARSPFDVPSYQLPERAAASDADQRADNLFQEALANNQRGDNYTLLAVLFATVLFFSAISQRAGKAWAQWTLLVLAIGAFVTGVVFLIDFPKLI